MRKRRHALVIRLLCSMTFVLLTGILPAHATQINLQTPSEMGELSELVVEGRVSEVRSFWNASGTKILTETRIEVAQSHKVIANNSLRIGQLGGEVDGVRMSVAGSLSWRLGEEVLVFLERMKSDDYRVSGFSQGKFLIERDARTGESYVRRPALVDTELMARAGISAPGKASQELRIPLQRFLAESLPQIRKED